MKIIAVILLFAMLVLVCACSGGETSVDTQADTTVADTTEADTTEALETESPQKPDPIVKTEDKKTLLIRDAETRVFVDSNGFELPYRIYVPSDYSEDYAYPLVLYLHGAGVRGNDNKSQLEPASMQPFMDTSCPIYQSIMIVPHCPNDYQWVDTRWDTGNYSTDEIPMSAAMSAVVELLDAMIEEFSINEDRQYVYGVSMGGYGTWDLIARFPDRFAAAIPLCGAGDPSKAADLVDVHIQTFHDVDDPIVPVSGTQEMVEAIRAAGGEKIFYTETSGYGHSITDITINQDDVSIIYTMFEQRRGK